MTTNEIAAKWWSDRFALEDKREELRLALLKYLPDGDWETYNDYDPEGPLLDAMRDVTGCTGNFFSGSDLPGKTGLVCKDGILQSKEGYGAKWVDVDASSAGVDGD